MSWAYRQDVAMGTRFVLVTLGNYADEYGLCWPSQGQLAEDCGCSIRKIRAALAELEGRGLIERGMRRRPDGTRRSDVIVLTGFAGRRLASARDPHPLLEEVSRPVDNSGDQAENPAGGDTTSGGDAPSATYDQPAGSAGYEPSKNNSYASAREGAGKAGDISARLSRLAGPGLCAIGRFAIHRTVRVIVRWLALGWDVDADMVPVVVARTARTRGSPIRTWAYFTEAIREARARRAAPQARTGRRSGAVAAIRAPAAPEPSRAPVEAMAPVRGPAVHGSRPIAAVAALVVRAGLGAARAAGREARSAVAALERPARHWAALGP